MAQIALAWVSKNPVVNAPVVGATKEHHLADAVATLDIELTDDEIKALEEHYTPANPPATDHDGTSMRATSMYGAGDIRVILGA